MNVKSKPPAAIAATALLLLSSTIAPVAMADTETVGGIEWTYSISNGEATIVTGEGRAAIPSDTAGDIVVPSTLGGCPVTAIGNYAFRDCEHLKTVTLPNGVTRIGGYAFYDCYDLTSVSIPNSVMRIGGYAFSYCYSLASISIPASVTNIENTLFWYHGLTSIQVAIRETIATPLSERPTTYCSRAATIRLFRTGSLLLLTFRSMDVIICPPLRYRTASHISVAPPFKAVPA